MTTPTPLPPARIPTENSGEPNLSLAHLLGNTVVPLDTLNPPAVTVRPPVQVHTRVVAVVLPASHQVACADAAIGRLAAVEVPGPGGEVDGVAGVIHGYVDVVVAVVLVRSGALSAVLEEGVSAVWRWNERLRVGLPVAADELVGLAVGAREERARGDGRAQGDDGCEEGCGVHGDWCESEISWVWFGSEVLMMIVLTVY